MKFLNEASDSKKEKRSFYDEPRGAIWKSKKDFYKKEDLNQKVSLDELKKVNDKRGKLGKYD